MNRILAGQGDPALDELHRPEPARCGCVPAAGRRGGRSRRAGEGRARGKRRACAAAGSPRCSPCCSRRRRRGVTALLSCRRSRWTAARLVASGVPFELRRGRSGRRVVRLEIRLRSRWALLARARADDAGGFTRTVRRAGFGTAISCGRSRRTAAAPARRGALAHVTLAAVGDVSLGDAPGAVMACAACASRGRASRAPCGIRTSPSATSMRGVHAARRCPRSSPSRPAGALRVMSRFAGFDVLNLANNHVGDYGTAAPARHRGERAPLRMTPVGAGGVRPRRARPRVVERLGLRMAFVGFSDILPASFFASPDRRAPRRRRSGRSTAGCERRGRRADVVIATFHWGVERATVENGRQRAFAAAALRAGADAVIGAHRTCCSRSAQRRRRLVAYGAWATSLRRVLAQHTPAPASCACASRPAGEGDPFRRP